MADSAGPNLILTPAFIENHIHDNAWKAHVMLNHPLKLQLKLVLLCATATHVGWSTWCQLVKSEEDR